jgi:hypothetical protein
MSFTIQQQIKSGEIRGGGNAKLLPNSPAKTACFYTAMAAAGQCNAAHAWRRLRIGLTVGSNDTSIQARKRIGKFVN